MEALEGCGAMESSVGLSFMESPFMEPQAQPNHNPMATLALTL